MGLKVVPRLSGIITHGLFAMFLLCPWCCSPSGLETSNGINTEVQVLLSIKAMLNDPNGALLSWDELAVDPCSWSLVTCSSENSVISLDGPSQNFSGTLSASIGNLTNLVTVAITYQGLFHQKLASSPASKHLISQTTISMGVSLPHLVTYKAFNI